MLISGFSHHGEPGLRPSSFADLFTRPNPVEHFEANIVLFREREAPGGVYVLCSGEVALVHDGADGVERGCTARAGEILGLSAVVSGRSHLSTAVTSTPCGVGFIEREKFLSMVDKSPALWFGVLRQLSQDVNESYEVIRKGDTRRPH